MVSILVKVIVQFQEKLTKSHEYAKVSQTYRFYMVILSMSRLPSRGMATIIDRRPRDLFFVPIAFIYTQRPKSNKRLCVALSYHDCCKFRKKATTTTQPCPSLKVPMLLPVSKGPNSPPMQCGLIAYLHYGKEKINLCESTLDGSGTVQDCLLI